MDRFVGLQSVPYIIGLLLTLVGWHISEISREITSSRSVLYSLETSQDKQLVTVWVENVSRTKSVPNSAFVLLCEKGLPCIDTESDENRLMSSAPTWSPANAEVQDSMVLMNVTLAAGGKIGMSAKWSDRHQAPKFYYLPDAENPIDIYVVESSFIRNLLTKHYFTAVLLSLGVLMVALFFATKSYLNSLTKQAGAVEAKPSEVNVSGSVEVRHGPISHAVEPDKETGGNG